MSKTCSFIKAGAILGGTVIVTAAVAPLFLPNQNVKPLTSAQAAEITAQTMNSKCADCHKPGTHISELVNTLSGGLLARHIRDGQRSYNMEEPPTAVTLSKLEHVLQINSMPPTSYTMVHWGSTLTLREKNAMLQWIKDERLKIFGDMVGEEYALSPLAPIPDALPTDPAKVALGYKLFHDVRLSTDNTVSCASCHSLEKAGTDNLPTSTGVRSQKGGINAPTVFNAAFHAKQFWDGRAANLQEQAGGPPLNPVEMGYEHPDDWKKIAAKLDQDTAFAAEFKKVYPQGFTGETITNAIAEYEKTLITPNSPFDRYLKGDENAISENAKKGYKLFLKLGCQTCHTGPAMGGQSFEYADLKGDFFAGRAKTNDDNGLMNFSKKESDRHRFRVPTLRNVELTWPYMHDASAQTLEEAITPPFFTWSFKRASAAVVPGAPAYSRPISSKISPTLSPTAGVGARDKSIIPKGTSRRLEASLATSCPTRVTLNAVFLIVSQSSSKFLPRTFSSARFTTPGPLTPTLIIVSASVTPWKAPAINGLSSGALVNTTSLALPILSLSAVFLEVSRIISPSIFTASMLIPVFVEPTLMELHTLSVTESASGIDSIRYLSAFVIPLFTNAE